MNEAKPEMQPTRMPVLFAGHGSPMNAIEVNVFSRGWKEAAGRLPIPKAILCVSAHWVSDGVRVSSGPQPRTIHDFGGFPPELYQVQYLAPGSPALAERVQKLVTLAPVGLDPARGLDHGTWSVLIQMYPQADIPVVQLSLDYNAPPQFHYELGKQLVPLREEGVLIVGSGNIVHNLGRVVWREVGFNEPFGLDWALEAQALFRRLIDERRHAELAGYETLGPAVQLAVPTPEHYLPLLYVLALQGENEGIRYFNDVAVAGSLTMTSLVVGEVGAGG